MAKVIIAAVVGVIVVICAFLAIDPNISKPTSNDGNGTTSSEVVSKISVEIQGAVVTPGTYTLSETSTLGDLIEKAGGLLESADYDCFDEFLCVEGYDLFYIPFIPGFSQECINTNITKVNVNEATEDELASINGISLTIAQAIIAYRETNGNFNTLEDLMKVTGIGIKTYEKIRDYVTIK